jgi:uncharacterized protein YgiM (DUF1202 family)
MKRRLPIVAAGALLLVSFTSVASAKVYTGWVIPEVLRVRSGPGDDRPVIGSVQRGDRLTVTAFVDGWCYAKLPDGRRGYVMEKYVQFSAEEGRKLEAADGSRASSSGSSDSGSASWVKVDEAHVRSGPGTSYSSYGTRAKGTKVYVVGRKGDWAKVRTPGGYGWMLSDLLTDDAGAGRQLAGTSTSGSASDEGGSPSWIKVDSARVRSGPGDDYEVYGTRDKGTKVYVVGRQGDWAKVKTPGGVGWIHTDLLTDSVETGQQLAATNSSGSSGSSGAVAKAFASGDNLYLRAGPGVRYDYRAVLPKGQTLHVIEARGDWVKVRVHGGHEGWVYKDYVKYADGSSASGSAAPPPPIPDFPSPTRQYSGGQKLTEMQAWTDTDANVRYGPGVDDEVKCSLDRGTTVTVTDISGQWCKVRLADGSYGWMAAWVLDYDGPGDDITVQEGGETVEVKVGWVARPEVNLRAGPSLSESVVGQAKLSTQVVILGRQDDWYKVGLDGGRQAWVNSALIDTREQRQARASRRSALSGATDAARNAYTAVASAASGLGGEIVQMAMGYRGSPYRYGCSGEGGAFDCSGFTSYLYRQKGISISRSCVQQFRQGTPVSRSELSPGDCVFFAGTFRSGISHVGIYIGNGEFIHASNPRSGVKVDRLDSSYYGPKYAGARRMR